MDWFKSNGLSVAIAIAGLVANYSVNTAIYGYRLTALEARMDRQGLAIESLQATNTVTLVALGKIQTDIEYIKVQINKLVP